MELKCKDDKVPRIFISTEAKQKLDLYIALCPEEISGLGQVIHKDGVFLIRDVLLFEQEVSATSTVLDGEGLDEFLRKAMETGQDLTTTKLWWHSHVNGGCFWSHTDDQTMERFRNGWMIAIVGNKRKEYLARIDLYEPVRLTIDGLTIEMYHPPDVELEKALKKEVQQKVKTIKVGYIHTHWGIRNIEIEDEYELPTVETPRLINVEKGGRRGGKGNATSNSTSPYFTKKIWDHKLMKWIKTKTCTLCYTKFSEETQNCPFCGGRKQDILP